jgi:hypothetical protein
LASANGPSITSRFEPTKRTRLAAELGLSPSPASITPAFTSSSLYLPMAVSRSALGIFPASEFLVALTITITRIGRSPGSDGAFPSV